MIMKFFRNRALRQGSAATAITVLAIALVVIVNMIFTILSERYNLTLDLTENSIFTLSQESIDFLDTVEKDVTVYILSSEETFVNRGQYYQQASEVIKRYAGQNNHIRLVYQDVVKDPTFIARYPDLTLNTGSILVESGDRQVVLTAYDLFNTQLDQNTYQTAITSSKAEQAFSSAILNVTSDNKTIVSVLEGHNEYPVEAFTELLNTNNYEVINQNLMTEEINPEATVAIICSPARDLTEAEAEKIDRFLTNNDRLGKTLFYMASATQQESLPVLDALLEEWGLRVGSGIVYETDPNNLFDMSYFMTLADYVDKDSTYSGDVSSRNLRMAIANSRPVEFLFDTRGGYTVSGLLDFSATSAIRPADAGEDWTVESGEPSGPYHGLAMSQTLKYDGMDPMISTILISGTETVVDGYLIGSPNLANSEYMLNLIGQLAGREETVVIQNKQIGASQLGATWGQVLPISIVFAIVVPIGVLAAGIVVWLIRRRK